MAERVLCGVPNTDCTGSAYITQQQIPPKAHGSRGEAFRCMTRYLMSQGYERIGQREFRPPNGGCILVLTKKSRFGGRLRTGKRAEGGTSTSRFMPDRGAGLIY